MGQRKGNNDVGFKKWKGLVTEQNIGQYEAEAAIDADNVEFLKDGVVRRRLGFETESGATAITTMTEALRSNAAYSTFLWEGINGIPELNIRLIQIGDTIKLLDDSYPVGKATLFATINLLDYSSGSGDAVESEPCQYAAGAGVLIVVARGIEPIRVTVVNKTNPPQVVVQQQFVFIRWDRLEGEHSASDQGNPNLTAGIEFDMHNSGWPFRADCANERDGNTAVILRTDPVIYFKSRMGFWPKPSFMFAALRLRHAVEPAPLGTFSPWEIDKINFGNTIPPLGHYITPAWDFDSRALMQVGIGGLSAIEDSSGWSLLYWAVDSVDADFPNSRFTATAVARYTSPLTASGKAGVSATAERPPKPNFNNTADGAIRIRWSTGDNSGTTVSVPAVGDGRGGFIMDQALSSPVKIGDRFTIV